MQLPSEQTIRTVLGGSNLLCIVPDGYTPAATSTTGPFLADLVLRLVEQLNAYAVLNGKYKRELMDCSDLLALQARPKVRDVFLQPIRRFKEEIIGNGLTPLLLIFNCLPPTYPGKELLLLGFGQGGRNAPQAPHRPTMEPSLVNKIRLACEDHDLSTALAPVDSDLCGRAPHHINQLFRQVQTFGDWRDPNIRSLLISIRPERIKDSKAAELIGYRLATALAPLIVPMPLVRTIDIDTIDVHHGEDLQYIFRLPGASPGAVPVQEQALDELAASIADNGLLHPLVLLQKRDGRHKILCGFRRFQAMRRLGRTTVEAKVYPEAAFAPDQLFKISLTENTRRRNLNPLEIGNFLESASKALGLKNSELAEQFGATLGIGRPGQQVAASTIHKYRKVNQLRLRGESPEILSDLVNEQLPFAIAAEILAPIKDPLARDSLYKTIIQPFSPTRPQLLQIQQRLLRLTPDLHRALARPEVQTAIAQAIRASQPTATLLRLLQNAPAPQPQLGLADFSSRVGTLRKRFFGHAARKKDFNITLASATDANDLLVSFRVKKGELTDTLQRVCSALEQGDLFAEPPGDTDA